MDNIHTPRTVYFRIEKPLAKFLKEKNIEALMEVLRDTHEIGTHASTTRGVALSEHVQGDPQLQEEVATVLSAFTPLVLSTMEDRRELFRFVSSALANPNPGAVGPSLLKLREKWIADFHDGIFSHIPPKELGQILTYVASWKHKLLSEEEVESLVELKEKEPGSWIQLMYDYNTHKALDKAVEVTDGADIRKFMMFGRYSETDVRKDAAEYLFSKYMDKLSEEDVAVITKYCINDRPPSNK